MKKAISVFSLILLCVFSTTFVACAKKVNSDASKIETRTISVGQISEIETGAIDVVITPGRGSGSAQLTGPVYLLDKIKMSTKQGKLDIFIKDGKKKKRSDIVKLVITADVHDIEAYAGANVCFTAPVATSRSFSVESYSSAVVKIPSLRAAKVDIESYSAGKIEIPTLQSDGNLDIESYSGGEVVINDVAVSESDFEAYSGGKIKVNAGSLGESEFEAYSGGSIDVKAVTTTVRQASYSGGHISLGK